MSMRCDAVLKHDTAPKLGLAQLSAHGTTVHRAHPNRASIIEPVAPSAKGTAVGMKTAS